MKKIFQLIVIIILLGFLIRSITSDWSTILTYWQNLKLNWLILSFMMALLIYPEGALGWYVILKRMRIDVPVLKVIRIWIIANTSRFLPGMIWQYIGRVELSKNILDRSSATYSMIVEIFLILLAAVLTCLITLPLINLQELEMKWVLLFLPVILILFHPVIFRKIITTLALLFKKKIDLVNFNFGSFEIISTLPYFIINFILNGLALSFLIAAFTGNLTVFNVFIYSGFYAFSWMIGYLAFFAPGGVGVTEVTLAFLLSQQMTLALSSLVVIFYRVALTMAELIIFLVFLRLRTENE